MISEVAHSLKEASLFDRLFRHLNLTKIFVNGWSDGNALFEFLNILPQVQKRSSFLEVPLDVPIEISTDKANTNEKVDCFTGKFKSPLSLQMNMREETQTCHFWSCVPKHGCRAVVLHFAGTGDHGYVRRKVSFAKPLLEHNLGSVIIENPFYGVRKPKEQFRSQLRFVSDLLVMGTALVMEANVIMRYLEKLSLGFPCLTGISLGGYTCSLAATTWPKPIPVVPCLSWTTSSNVYTQGLLSTFVNWPKLQSSMPDLNQFEYQNRFIRSASSTKLEDTISAQVLLFQLLEAATHLGNYSALVDPRLATVVVATKDAYIPRNTDDLTLSVWPGATRIDIEGGHMQGILNHSHTFRDAILQTVNRYEHLYLKT